MKSGRKGSRDVNVPIHAPPKPSVTRRSGIVQQAEAATAAPIAATRPQRVDVPFETLMT
jgi:hypothetical protein